MKRAHIRLAPVLALAVALAACGGNYSNDDLLYAYALPQRADLQAKVPSTATNSGALQSRQSALAIGDESQVYKDTRGVSLLFNGALEFFLGIVDTVRKNPPTARKENERIWGPFKDDQHPGWDIRMVMDRDGQTFSWKIELRPHSSKDESAWVLVLNGRYAASGEVKKGKGEVHFFAHALRANGLAGSNDDGKLAQLDVTYVTDELPTKVDMQLSGEPTSDWSSIDYTYRGEADGGGAMTFLGTNGNGSLDVRSGWTKSGAGRANVVFNAQLVDPAECWDSNFRVTYFNHPWELFSSGPTGDVSSCPTVQGL